ncbi:MAG: arylsulfatase [Bacteroidales bacterium]|nr:arylsulfatase [Bacteroidales bacterium]
MKDKILIISRVFSVFFILAHLTVAAYTQDLNQVHEKPNIILIMGDDMGFSDLGCFGSEIKTPNLDYLARQGIRFRQFYNMAKCSPTRSTMLTGLYGRYEQSVPVSRLLSDSGYRTIMCGKNHMVPSIPDAEQFGAAAFDQSLTFWVSKPFFFNEEDESPFYINGKQVAIGDMEISRQPFFKTDVFTDYAIRWLTESVNDNQPFFLYMPYHVAHFPIQARPEDIARYRGKYMQGWDRLRQQRFEKMKKEGVVPEDCLLSPAEDFLHNGKGKYNSREDDPEWRDNFWRYRTWESLSPEEQDEMELEMAVFAGMIDRMDQNIGRIIESLHDLGQLDNTLIIYLSDNGAEAQDYNVSLDLPPGHPDSRRSMHAVWSSLSNTPFRQYKWFGLNGGCSTHFIAFWPGMIPSGSITNQVGHVVDITPTLLEVAGIDYPSSYKGDAVEPLHGKSLLPVLEGGRREDPEWFISGMPNFRMFRKGDWKITQVNGGAWMLFDLENDYTELHDLSGSMPEFRDKMILDYQEAVNQVDLFNIWEYRRTHHP